MLRSAGLALEGSLAPGAVRKQGPSGGSQTVALREGDRGRRVEAGGGTGGLLRGWGPPELPRRVHPPMERRKPGMG